MEITPSLRQLMSDKASLTDYWQGCPPDFSDVKRRLFLLERQSDTRLPDHYYRRGQDVGMVGIENLPDLLTKGLQRLGASHLEFGSHGISVKREALSSWQDLLTFCPPLPLVCAVLWHEKFIKGTRNTDDIAAFVKTYIQPNTRHTCLPSPHYPALERVRRIQGFYDLHLHLNGSTEIDTAWQLFLNKPYSVYKALFSVCRKSKTKELFEQEAFGLNRPLDVYTLLIIAQTIRRAMVHALFSRQVRGNDKEDKAPSCDEKKVDDQERFQKCNISVCLKCIRQKLCMFGFSSAHPMQELFGPLFRHDSKRQDTCLEGVMYVLVMDRLNTSKNMHLAALFHYYLLILGFFNRLLVQQKHQNGFDQFQKITDNGFREPVEKSFEKRFYQLHGNGSANLALIEGRFSPKASPKENMVLLKNIISGWERFRDQCGYQLPRILGKDIQKGIRCPNFLANSTHKAKEAEWCIHSALTGDYANARPGVAPDKPQLRLVAHFIKQKDTEKLSDLPSLKIRHRKLRIVNWKKARALVYVLKNDWRAKKYITGVDAAANELEAPPEVFAPIYRYLRKKGVSHFTYHAGEDFHHLAGGLRAIYEAVEFLDLRPGDRIGHATAAGIHPDFWFQHVGRNFVISRGEWLDDLIFVLHILEKYPESPLNKKLAGIRAEVDRHAQEVYQKHYAIYSHIQAWRLRRFCPMHLLYGRQSAQNIPTWSLDEWRACDSANSDKEARSLLRLYHREDCRKKYHHKIRIETLSVLAKDDLIELQYLILKELSGREIVIEVPPTSNVRISFYQNHGEHHLFRWLGLGKGGIRSDLLPLTVVGTDDPGIFSTNIFNEYCHIYHQLVTKYKQSHEEAFSHIRRLMENAKIYSF